MEKKWWTLLVVCGATFMLLLDVTIVIVALPQIQTGLHATFSDVQWTIDAYALTLASLLLTAGSLADLFGRRRLFIIGLAVFTAGSLLCGVSQTSLMLILSRSAQGIGGAILFSTSLALLASNFAGKERGVAFGIWGAVTGVATSLGPILGGLITTDINWRGIFLVNVPIGAAALVITWWKVNESRPPHAVRPDWPGFAALTGGLIGVVYGLIRASETAWSDSGVIVSLTAGAVLVLVFVLIERRVANPMFDLSLFRTPTFLGGSIAAFAMNGSLFSMFLYLVLYLQDDLGYSALGAGMRMLIVSGGGLVAATISGRLTSVVPIRWLLGPGLGLVGLGLFLMSGIGATTSWAHLVAGFIVAGIGSGMVNPPLASTAVGVVEPRRAGMASGVNTTFRQIGIAVSIAALASIFTSALQKGLNHALTSIPALAGKGSAIVNQIRQGNPASALASVPAAQRAHLAGAIRISFAGAMNDLLVTTGVLALVGGAFSLVLIRRKDFVSQRPDIEAQSTPSGEHGTLAVVTS